MLTLIIALLLTGTAQAEKMYHVAVPTITVYSNVADTAFLSPVMGYAVDAKAFFADSLKVNESFTSMIGISSASNEYIGGDISGVTLTVYADTQSTLVDTRGDMKEKTVHELVHQTINANDPKQIATRRVQEGLAVVISMLATERRFTVTMPSEVTTDDIIVYLTTNGSSATDGISPKDFKVEDYDNSAAAIATLTHNDPRRLAYIINHLADGVPLWDVLLASSKL